MDIKILVANYATKTPKGVEVNLEALAKNAEFRSQAVKEIVKKVKKQPHACVLFPSYKNEQGPLASLINELALTLQVETLVTGNLEKIQMLMSQPNEVIMIKQAFRGGNTLKKQVKQLKDMGCEVCILCLVAHSGAALQGFAYENDVEVSALVYTDELEKVG